MVALAPNGTCLIKKRWLALRPIHSSKSRVRFIVHWRALPSDPHWGWLFFNTGDHDLDHFDRISGCQLASVGDNSVEHSRGRYVICLQRRSEQSVSMRKIRTSAAWLDQRTPDAERCNLFEETFYPSQRRPSRIDNTPDCSISEMSSSASQIRSGCFVTWD